MSETPALLAVSDLSVAFHGTGGLFNVVDRVSFKIARGEVLGIVGESGSGKTLTAMAVMRLLPEPNGRIAGGRILFDGRDLVQARERELQAIRGRRIGMVFQEPMSSLNPVRTIASQITEPLRVHLGMDHTEARRRALELLDRVRIPSAGRRLDSYPHELSGGQRQRVMIAIAIACGPDLLIADEPTTALDVTIQAQILDLLRELQSETGMGVILITHDLGIVAEFANRVAVMYAGRIVEEGPVAAFFEQPAHAYTKALLASLPDPEAPTRRLVAIPGAVPNPGQVPPGCRFAPRCGLRRPVCTSPTLELELRSLAAGRRVACLAPFGYEASNG